MAKEKVLIEYNDSDLHMEGLYSLSAIAKANHLISGALAKHYEDTNDIYKAVQQAKEKQKVRSGRIIWEGEQISLVKLAEKLEISNTTLSRYYKQTRDIEQAVQMVKKLYDSRYIVLQNGKKMTIEQIAKENNLTDHILMREYKKTGNIEQAIQNAKKNQEKFYGQIFYPKEGKMRTANYIAKDNAIHPDTFKKYYKKTGNTNKAILLSKEGQRRYNKNKIEQSASEGEWIDAFSLRNLNRKVDGFPLEKKVHGGKKYQKGKQSLFSYCLEKSLNYDVILNLINTYSLSVDEAITHYRKYGQEIPTNWIYEKYDVLFRHLMLSFQIRSDRIIQIMKEENCNLYYAVEKYIFTKDRKEFSSVEVSLLFEIYEFLKICSKEECVQVLTEFYITKEEMDFIFNKQEEIDKIERKLLLYDFSEVIDCWDERDSIAMMKEYNITEDELVEICSNLYANFSNQVLSGDLSKEREYITEVSLFIKKYNHEDDDSLDIRLNHSNLLDKDKEAIKRSIHRIQKFRKELNYVSESQNNFR